MLKGEVIRNIYYRQRYSLYKGLNIYPLDGTNSCLNCNDDNAFIFKSEALYVYLVPTAKRATEKSSCSCSCSILFQLTLLVIRSIINKVEEIKSHKFIYL